MTWSQLAIEIPVVVAFAIFTLQLIKLNNKQTDAFIAQLTTFQTAFFSQLDLQSKIFDVRNDSLIQALRTMQSAGTASDKALVQALTCLAKQIEYISSILINQEILKPSETTHLYKGLITSNRKARTNESQAPNQASSKNS